MTDQRASIYPALGYRDAHAAIEWLQKAFGLEPIAVYEDGDKVAHAELRWRNGVVMLGSVDAGSVRQEPGGSSIYLVVDDPDAHFEQASAAGAEIVLGLEDEDYGSRGYTARDPEGNLWSFGTYAPEI